MSMKPTPAAPTIPAEFGHLVWSNLAAQSAEQIGLAAAPIVAVFAFGAGAGETGWLQTAQTLPFLFLAIPAGILADRSSRKGLMVASEAVRTLSLLAILILAETGTLSLWLLAVFGFIGATGTVAYGVAAPSLVASLVPREALPSANGRIELARSVAFASGPALAGALVGWLGGGPAFAVAALLSASAVALLMRLREPPRPPVAPRHPLIDIREGAAFVFSHKLLMPVFITQFIFNTAFFVMQAVYVPYAAQRLHLTPVGVGLTLAVYGVGMVVGAFFAARLMRTLTFGAVVAIGPICGFAAAVSMALTILVPSVALAALSFFLIGVGPILWVVSTTTLRQSVTPHAMLGRVTAIFSVAYGTRPLGAAIGAVIGSIYGAEACLIIATVGFLIQAIVIIASPVPGLASQPRLPDEAAPARG